MRRRPNARRKEHMAFYIRNTKLKQRCVVFLWRNDSVKIIWMICWLATGRREPLMLHTWLGYWYPGFWVFLQSCFGLFQLKTSDALPEPPAPPTKSSSRHSLAPSRSSATSAAEEQPHVGNYRLLKTIGKGNFAKVKLARHTLTGREVRTQRRVLNPKRSAVMSVTREWQRGRHSQTAN